MDSRRRLWMQNLTGFSDTIFNGKVEKSHSKEYHNENHKMSPDQCIGNRKISCKYSCLVDKWKEISTDTTT